MIIPMQKVYLACSSAQRDTFLTALREAGVVHLLPIDPETAVAEETTQHELDAFNRSIQILEALEPQGETPQLSAVEAVHEVQRIHRQTVERENRLGILHRQIEQLELWGDTKTESLDILEAAGVCPRCFIVPQSHCDEFQADFVNILRELPGHKNLVAVIHRSDAELVIPEQAEELEQPKRDRPAIRAEAAELDQAIQADEEILRTLAHCLPAIERHQLTLQEKANFTIAQRGGVEQGPLYAVQGWLPSRDVAGLQSHLAGNGLTVAMHKMDPEEDEAPPTLVEYPRWAKPIKALFQILGTTPGYREYDLSPFFMLAMPIFTAMLVGDAGYGLIFTLVALLFGKKITKATGDKTGAQLILSFGLATIVWGLMSGNIFGVSPYDMQGAWAWLGDSLKPLAVLVKLDANGKVDAGKGRDLVMQIAFTLGVIHLVAAQLRQAIGVLPDQRGLANLGWAVFLVGMYGVVWAMFFAATSGPIIPPNLMIALLIGGFIPIVLFSSPNKNPIKRIALGLVGNIMPSINTFGDTMSYIRLMAVGLASYYIASAFNGLGMQLADGWTVVFTVIILIAAHLLNIALCLIAIFAHGVRLNMLEFSNNAGVQWVGHPYAPFTKTAMEGDI